MKKINMLVSLIICSNLLFSQRNDRGLNFQNTPLPANLESQASWDLITGMSDDFNHNTKGSKYNDVWAERYLPDDGFRGPGSTQWVIRNPGQEDFGVVQIANGKAEIRAYPGSGGLVNCGIITSRRTVKFPVFMEARIKVSAIRNSSNFWMLNKCDNEEIDVLECYGGDPDPFYAKQMSTNFHIWHRRGGQSHQDAQTSTNCGGQDITDFTYQTFFTTDPNSTNLSNTDFWREEFHNFGVYWKSPTEIFFYLDGVARDNGQHFVGGRNASSLDGSFEDARMQCPNASVLRCATESLLRNVQGQSGGGVAYPNRQFNDPTHIIIDTEAHAGRPVETADNLNDNSKNVMLVDWVRVYRPSGGGSTGGNNNGGDTGNNDNNGGNNNGGSNSGANLAAGRSAFQSSTFQNNNNFAASRAVDTNGSSFNHTNSQNNPWWEVDLGSSQNISSVRITNRGDCCANRLNNFDIRIFDRRGGNQIQSVFVSGQPSANGTSYDVNATGRVVRIQLRGNNRILHMDNVEVFGGGTSTGGNNSGNTGGNNSGQLIANGLYRITNPRLNQSLLTRALENHDARVVDTGNFADQQWRFAHLGDNIYTIKNNGTGRYLEVQSAQCFNGGNVKTWTNSDGDHKKWRVERNGNVYTLKPTHCLSRAMDVAGGQRNGEIHIWAANPNNDNQKWDIVRLGNKEITPKETAISVYPNPAIAYSTITIDGLTVGNSIAIFNSLGQQVKQLYAGNESEIISTNNMTSGVYFIQIDTNETLKLIIQ